MLNMPFRENTFDVTYSLKVLPHIQDIKKAISEMVRVTKPNGIVIAEFYNALSLCGIRYYFRITLFPQKISSNVTEKDVFTRYDFPWKIKKYLPKNVEIVEKRGMMIFCPLPVLYKVSFFARFLKFLDRVFQRTFIKYFGGFYIIIMKKSKIN